MADGSVIIETKIDTGGITKGIKDIKKQLEKAAGQAGTAADKIEMELNSVDAKTAGQKIADDINDALKQVDAGDLAGDISDPIKDGFGDAEKASRQSTEEIKDDLEKVGKQSQETGEKIGSGLADAFKKVGSVITAALAVDKGIDFAKETVNAAAEVRAENAKFSQTFKELEGTATESLQAVSKETRITATRMQDDYSDIYAFARASGAETAEALDLSNRAMKVAADSAAYYDTSIEDATATLQSFLKGNFENDAALNVSATETTRNAAAMELFGQKYNDLTEIQKQQTLLKMVEDAQALSGAMGQAARESDSWANVTGELQEAWRQLQAVIGEPILDYITPIVQDVTEHIYGLKDLVENFSLNDLFDGVDPGPLQSSFQDLLGAAQGLADVVGGALSWAWDNVLVPLGTWSIDAGLPAAIDALASGFEAVGSVLEWLEPLASGIWENFLQPLGSFVGDGIVSLLDGLATGFQSIGDYFANSGVNSFELFTNAMNQTSAYMSGSFVPAFQQGFDQIQQSGADAFDQITTTAESSMSTTNTAVGTTAEITQEKFQQIGDTASTSTSAAGVAIRENLGGALAAVEESTVTAGEQIASTMSDTTASIEDSFVAPTAEETQTLGTEMEETFSNAAKSMEESFAGTSDYFDANVTTPISSGFEDIRSTALSTWSKIQSATDSAWDDMVRKVSESIDEMQDKIDSLQGKTVTVAVNTSGVSTASAAAVASMPMLARGAVIPPNAPFAAILGDQRNGTNIEAPLDTIKQAVAEVIGEDDRQIIVQVNVTYTGDLAMLAKYMKPSFDAEAHRAGENLATEVIW